MSDKLTAGMVPLAVAADKIRFCRERDGRTDYISLTIEGDKVRVASAGFVEAHGLLTFEQLAVALGFALSDLRGPQTPK